MLTTNLESVQNIESVKNRISGHTLLGVITLLSLIPLVYFLLPYYKDQEILDYKPIYITACIYSVANIGFAFYYLKNKILESKESSSLSILFLFNVILMIPVFPISLTFYLLNPVRIFKTIKHTFNNRSIFGDKLKSLLVLILSKIGFIIFLIITIFPFWFALYFSASNYVRNEYLLNRDSINVVGTGSMYPTFPKGDGTDPKELSAQVVASPGMTRYPSGVELFDKRFFSYEIIRGDIVSFTNNTAKEIIESDGLNGLGFIKRVIALPGETIELRDGLVYINDNLIDEPYIATARSTFGGETLQDCKKLTIPENKLFVMGDNRKSSHDSRFKLGLINYADIDHVIPLSKQKNTLDKNWRDTSNDQNANSKIKLDKIKYLENLNKKRSELGLTNLKINNSLNLTATERGLLMFKTQNFEPNTSEGADSMKQILQNKNLSTILIGEAAVKGYYNEQELIENQFEFSVTREFLTNKDFNEIGIAEVEGLVDNCPAQVIVSHLSGYIPPTYTQDQIDSINNSIVNLKQSEVSWLKIKNEESFYNDNKQDIDRIFEIFRIQINNYESIRQKMLKTLWLDEKEEKFISDENEKLVTERDILIDKINKKIEDLSK